MPDSTLPRPGPTRSKVPATGRDWIAPAAALATLGIHAVILAWLLMPRLRAPVSAPLQVEWIRRDPAPAVPPMPQAPARADSRRARPPVAGQGPSNTASPLDSTSAALESVPEPALDRPPDSAVLYRHLQAEARRPGGAAAPGADPLERSLPPLPGRGEAFVEGFHVRQQATPADYVAMVGSLLFGGYQGATCGDIRRKISSDISDAERIKLIHDERAICRRGQAGTYLH